MNFQYLILVAAGGRATARNGTNHGNELLAESGMPKNYKDIRSRQDSTNLWVDQTNVFSI